MRFPHLSSRLSLLTLISFSLDSFKSSPQKENLTFTAHVPIFPTSLTAFWRPSYSILFKVTNTSYHNQRQCFLSGRTLFLSFLFDRKTIMRWTQLSFVVIPNAEAKFLLSGQKWNYIDTQKRPDSSFTSWERRALQFNLQGEKRSISYQQHSTAVVIAHYYW